MIKTFNFLDLASRASSAPAGPAEFRIFARLW
jgi:hypothetical protein